MIDPAMKRPPNKPAGDTTWTPDSNANYAPLTKVGESGLRSSLSTATAAWAKRLLGRMHAALGNPPIQLVLWNGQVVPQISDAAWPQILIHDLGAVLHLASSPVFQFGEMYAARRVEVRGDLAQLLETIFRILPDQRDGNPRPSRWRGLIAPRRRISPVETRRNVRHHYDLGNPFYRLWLDRQMLYSCAYFPDKALSLEDAQVAKMDLICRKLRLKPGEKVIDIGSGWGALALHMARHYGVTVQGYNLSREQVAFSRERARSEGLAGRVEFVLDDFRHARGEFDAFVSVGMLEHVGPEHYRDMGEAIDRVLKPEGRGLMHSIGRDYPRPMDAWIERHIFPAACPPSLAQMMAIFEPSGFSILDVENLRLHYALTLEHWRKRFEDAAAKVSDMFSPAMVRTWRLYLAGSLAAFRSGDLQLFQVLFTRSRNNRIPWTRETA